MSATRRDLVRHTHPALAVDLVLMTVAKGRLRVLVQRRRDENRVGEARALPGTIVRLDETVEQAAHRALRAKTGIGDVLLRQLRVYSGLDRDPRGRVISTAFLALLPPEQFEQARKGGARLHALTAHLTGGDETGWFASVRDRQDRPISLAFDHARIVGDAIAELRQRSTARPAGLDILPAQFPLRELQAIQETLLGHPVTRKTLKREFARTGAIRRTGQRERRWALYRADLYEAGPLIAA